MIKKRIFFDFDWTLVKSLLFLKKNYRSFSLEHFTTFVGLLGQLAIYVQAIKIFYLKSACAVSLSAYLIALGSMICWFAYGVSKDIKPLIFSNIFGIIGIFLVIGGILYYG